MAPIRKVPSGTTTLPPPAALQASIALWIASVDFVWPPATAPYFVMFHSRLGKEGGFILARMAAAPTGLRSAFVGEAVSLDAARRPAVRSNRSRRVITWRNFDIELALSRRQDLFN